MKKIVTHLAVAAVVLSTLLFVLPVNANPVTSVWVDIKPGSCPNSINPNSKGVVPVAIYTTGFDATTVDPETVEFAGASPLRWAIEDVDGRWGDDIIFHFKTQELDLMGSGMYTLTGETYGGEPISGSGWVNIVPKGPK